MSFSQEWEKQYADGCQQAVWPWSDLVGLVKRHCPNLAGKRVLELGCGAGANIPFFAASQSHYHAIEGSQFAVQRLHERFPELNGTIIVGDFTKGLPDAGFDLIIDRASLAHNDTKAIKSCLQFAWDAIKPGGLFIGVDWFSTNHDEFGTGEPDVDEETRSDYQSGQFAGVGRVHFSDEAALRTLFAKFDLIYLEEKIVRRVIPHGGYQAATWNLVARKP
jgi:SAM-dependent methyltransferase